MSKFIRYNEYDADSDYEDQVGQEEYEEEYEESYMECDEVDEVDEVAEVAEDEMTPLTEAEVREAERCRREVASFLEAERKAEMEAEFRLYEKKMREEREREEARMAELDHWVEENGGVDFARAFTYDQLFTMMDKDKEEKLAQWKKSEEEKRQQYLADCKKAEKEMVERRRAEAKARLAQRSGGANKEGKNQGALQKAAAQTKAIPPKSKRQLRKERREKNVEKARQTIGSARVNKIYTVDFEEGVANGEYEPIALNKTIPVQTQALSAESPADDVVPESKTLKESDEDFTVVAPRKRKRARKISDSPSDNVVRLLNFNGLIDQARESRCASDRSYSSRSSSFKVMGDKKEMDKKLTHTSMCRSVIQGVKCPHKERGRKCRFAHSLDELIKRECTFGTECRFVRNMGNGEYKDCPSSRTGKTCNFWHPNETDESYRARNNLPPAPSDSPKVETLVVKSKVATPKVATPKVATPKVATPKVATPKVATPKVATPKVAPWAQRKEVDKVSWKKIPKNANMAMQNYFEKKRSEPKKVETKVPEIDDEGFTKVSNRKVSKGKVSKGKPSPKKRTEPNRSEQAPPTIIRVPAIMRVQAHQMAKAQGLTNYRIELV